MDWLDYREKLGLGFCDEEKIKIFYIKLFNILDGLDDGDAINISFNEYYAFCNDTGTEMNTSLTREFDGPTRFGHCISILKSHRQDINDFLSFYIWFANLYEKKDDNDWDGKSFIKLLTKALDECHLPYSLIEKDGKFFVFPKGAKEFDDVLVSEPLAWLKDYPTAYKTYCIALKQYADGTYIRDVADNLRKALEEFLREFLQNDKDMSQNKKEVEKYLRSQNADSHLITLLTSLLNHYYILNNEVAKHKDKLDGKYLEFLLYQTGIFIRMLIVVKEAKDN